MTRLVFLCSRLVLAFFVIGGAAAPAYAGAYYQAQPIAKLAQARLILRDVVWKCGAAGCAADKSNSRPAIVCALLVRQVGRVESFTVNGRSLDSAELEKCNARAK